MKMMRFAGMAAVLALAISTANPQSATVMEHANFVLQGTTQTPSGALPVRIGNKDIIAALNSTGAYQFGPKATLLFVSTNDQPPALVVRDVSGRSTKMTDVSSYLGLTAIGNEVASANERTRWQTWYFALDNRNTNGETGFQLWGSTTIHRGTFHARGIGTVFGPQRIQSTVRGVGRVQGAVTVFLGTVSGAGSTLVKQ